MASRRKDNELDVLTNYVRLDSVVLQSHRKVSVHPGLLWVEAETAAVEEDGCFEVLAVSESTDAAFD